MFAQHLAIAVLTTVSVCSSDPDPLSMTSLQNQNQSILLEQRKQSSSVLIGELKGILLLGKETSVKTSGSIQGIEWTDLAIPGRPYDLWKELSVFLNQPVTAQTIKEIKEAISAHYLRESHPFVAIRVPEQEVTSGTLRLIVRESKIGTISVEGNCHFPAENIKSYYKIQPGEPINQNHLLQATSFLNRNPFRRIDLVFAPGKEEGTTDIILLTKDRRPLRVYAGTDNLGVQPVGPNQWYAGFNAGNLFRLGHLFSYQYTTSYNIHLFQAHTAEYTAFLPWGHLLDVYGGYSEVHPPVPPPFKRNDGWSMQASLRYLIPLRIYHYLEHEISTGFDFKRTNNTFEFTEAFSTFGKNTNLTQLTLGYGGNYEQNMYRFDFKGSLFWSPGRLLSDQTNDDYSSLRPGAVNHWVYFRGYFIYLQRLPQSFSFSLRLQGQGSSEPLLPSEQLGLGGYETIRGYEEREINVDNGLVLNLEARSPGLPIAKWIKPTCSIPDALQFLVFLDSGWGVNIDTIPGTRKVNYLMGVGPGARYTLEPYLTARLDWGIRLHNQASFPGNWSRLHFNVTASY